MLWRLVVHRERIYALAQRAEPRAPAPLSGLGARHLNTAALALARGNRDEAVRLFDSGKQKLTALGVALDPNDQSEVDWMTRQIET